MKEKCPLCGNDKEPTGMQLLCHPPITEMACRKCQPGKFPYLTFDVKRHDEAALKQLVWDGTGVPPVGVECEVSVDGGRTWCSYKALNERNGMRLIEVGNFTEEFMVNDWTFRPIRTERDEAIEQMLKLVTNYNKTDVIHAIGQLYDAGYRKLSD